MYDILLSTLLCFFYASRQDFFPFSFVMGVVCVRTYIVDPMGYIRDLHVCVFGCDACVLNLCCTILFCNIVDDVHSSMWMAG